MMGRQVSLLEALRASVAVFASVRADASGESAVQILDKYDGLINQIASAPGSTVKGVANGQVAARRPRLRDRPTAPDASGRSRAGLAALLFPSLFGQSRTTADYACFLSSRPGRPQIRAPIPFARGVD